MFLKITCLDDNSAHSSEKNKIPITLFQKRLINFDE